MENIFRKVGWEGSIPTFFSTTTDAIIIELEKYRPSNSLQVTSWRNSIDYLKQVCNSSLSNSTIKNAFILFEYELPREGGRRPDILIICTNHVIVIEVKDTKKWDIAHLDQTKGYVRDLQEYHYFSRSLRISGVLLVTKGNFNKIIKNDISVISKKEDFVELIKSIQFVQTKLNFVQEWIHSPYEPLPSIIFAAKTIFQNQPLPQIRTATSARIPQTTKYILSLINRAKEKKEHAIILISGEPGAGKTLIGLQLVYEFSKAYDRESRGTFLSGNGPLVEVLQFALSSRVFVQDVHRFIREYGFIKTNIPLENVLIFDEAQRAWDKEKMINFYLKKKDQKKYKKYRSFIISQQIDSEPMHFTDILSRKDWGIMICLIGRGQEIHNGEESGVGQWQEAIQTSFRKWKVFLPSNLKEYFQKQRYEENDLLNLSAAMRTHVAEGSNEWVDAIMQGKPHDALKLANDLKLKGFAIRIIDDLDKAKDYMIKRYKEEEKTFGIIASSKSRNLKNYGLDTSFKSRQVVRPGKYGPWYYFKDRFELYCKSLNQVVTEFGIQGLELDGTIVAWGIDMKWNGTKWETPRITRKTLAKDPHQLRINSYRVLLTRSRDGMVIFIPGEEMKPTMEYLVSCGFEKI